MTLSLIRPTLAARSERAFPAALLALICAMLALGAAASMAAQGDASGPQSDQKRHAKVIVLGFDGIDPDLARRFMDEGHLPAMKKLADNRGMVPLDTVFPSQSPVCWSSMLTGTNPGKHGVTGFVKRTEGTYNPELGIIRIGQRTVAAGKATPWLAAIAMLAATAVVFVLVGKATGRGWARCARTGVYAGLPIAVVIAMVVHAYVPATVPQPISARHGEAFFEPIAKAGYKVALLNTPMDWPVPTREGVLEYAGFNVPDLRGTFGIYSFWTTDFTAAEYVKSEMGADVRRVRFGSTARAEGGMPSGVSMPRGATEIAATTLEGPRNLTKPRDGYPTVKVPLVLGRNEAEGWLGLATDPRLVGGGDGEIGRLKVGQWSEWVTLRFALNPLVKVQGRVRFFLEELSPVLRLYCTPVSVDPLSPAGENQIANPPSFGAEVQDIAGEQDNPGMDTLGWPELTHPMYDENLRDQAFMDHCVALEGKRARVLEDVLKRREHDLVCAWFYGPDRVQHMMWRYIDPQHHDYATLQRSHLKDSVLRIYQFMDDVIAKTQREHCGPDTLLLVMSDHGFAPFRRAVSINRWLVENGYLVLKGAQEARHATDLFSKRDQLLGEIDWARTRAYAMGLGDIFLNLKGREPLGVVEPRDAFAVCLEIKDRLESLTDPDAGGAKVVSRVYLRDGIPPGTVGREPQFPMQYGRHTGGFAELLVGFHPGYRVSWQTTLGYANEPVVFTNSKRWSGDHCSLDPLLIPGVLLSNRPLASTKPNLMAVAPTVLREFGLLDFVSTTRGVTGPSQDEPFDSPPLDFADGRFAGMSTKPFEFAAVPHKHMAGPGWPMRRGRGD